jgi:hypothetical protein
MGAIRHIEAADTPYAYIISTANSEWWNSDIEALETFDIDNLLDYQVIGGSQFGTTGKFSWTFPSSIPKGQYSVFIHDGDDDSTIEAGVVDWDGNTLIVSGNILSVDGVNINLSTLPSSSDHASWSLLESIRMLVNRFFGQVTHDRPNGTINTYGYDESTIITEQSATVVSDIETQGKSGDPT